MNQGAKDSVNIDVHSLSDKTFCLLDFNCKNLLTCGPLFQQLGNTVDIYLLQEHWLSDCQLGFLNHINERYYGVGKAVDSNDPIPPFQMPRGYGGTAILWKKRIEPI